MPTSKNNIRLRQLMEKDIVMKHPCITLLSGSAGGGKSTFIYNMLTNPLMYGPSIELLENDEKGRPPKERPYFDCIFLFIGSLDDAYAPLIAKKIILKEHVKVHPTEDELQSVISSQKKLLHEAKGNIMKIPKILFIMDDLVSNQKLLRSKPLLEIFTAGRQINSSLMFASQYINIVPKSLRQQASYNVIFKCNRVEAQCFAEQYCPPQCSMRFFYDMLDHCTKDDEDCKNNFMMISKKAPISTRFRKNMNEFVQIPEITKTPHVRRKNKASDLDESKREEDEDLQKEMEKNYGEVEFDPSSELNMEYQKEHQSSLGANSNHLINDININPVHSKKLRPKTLNNVGRPIKMF